MTSQPIYLTCPACARCWHAATLTPGAWWAKGISPQAIASQTHCRCGQRPPMQIASNQQQLRLELSA